MLALRRMRGFSLVELMVVIAVAAVLLGIAVGDLTSMIRHQQLKAALSDLFGAIDLTRSQAITRATRVYLVPGDGGWSSGWKVFVDADGDGMPGDGDELIAVHGPLPEGIIVTSGFTSPRTPDYIAYNSGGRSCSHASSMAARWGTLSLTLDGQTRRIKINMLGRARACDPARDGESCSGPETP
jgi:type IV fimbrial biogenesis protein FimT